MTDLRASLAPHASLWYRNTFPRSRRRWICDQDGPVLRDKGLLFTGINVIGDFMTEINVTSPTGIREIEHASDVRVAERLMDAIQALLKEK